MICTTVKELLAEPIPGDLIELRLDYFAKIDLAQIRLFIKQQQKPVIFTLRKKSQGGFYRGTEEERLQLLAQLADLNPAYMDLEYNIPTSWIKELERKHPSIKWIISYHNFTETPENLENLFQKMQQTPAHLYKIAVMSKNILDTLRLLIWLKESGRKNVIGISMGSVGEPGRILAPFLGSPFTYASLHEEENIAPGQLSYHELKRYTTFVHPTFYGLIGNPISLSPGHLVHNEIMAKEKLNALYVKMTVTLEELPSFMLLIKQLNFRGLSVTMPLKEAILPFIDSLSPDAKEIGAVNTLLIENGKIKGFNTDGKGAILALKKHTSLAGKKVIIIGAGGTAKAILYEVKKAGAEVILINRDANRGKRVAELFNVPFLELAKVCLKSPYDILINATPHPAPIDPESILPETFVMDVNTQHKDTAFLQAAQSRKCKIVSGYEMFLQQAAMQREIWFPTAHN